jgi:hypothetical protein
MRNHPTLVLILVVTASLCRAQYVPPSPAGPVPGALDAFIQSQAQGLKGWEFGLNERVRYEDKDDAGTTHAGSNYDFDATAPSTNSNDYWLTRLMPRAGFSDDWISLSVEARSSYSLGDDRFNPASPGKNLPEDDGPIQIETAFIALGNLKKFPLLVKIGRQELTYGEQRLVGSALWLNVPHTFDAVKVRYQDALFGVDVFAANLVYVKGSHFDDSNSQDTLSGAYFDLPGISKANVNEAYLFARNVSRGILTDNWVLVPAPFRFTAPEDLYTFGYRAKSKPDAYGPWDYGVEAMWQTGDRTAVFPATTLAAAKAAPRLSQDAWAFVLQCGHTWADLSGRPRLAAIVSCASGDANSSDKTSETFQNLIPSNHGLYGLMDLSSLQNIEDFRLDLTSKPTAATSLALDLHQQYLENTHDYWYNVAGVPRNTPGAAAGSGKGFGLNPGYSSDIGSELDLVGGWTVKRGLLLEFGLGHLYRGDYIKESLRVVGSKDAEYGYLQATVNL